MNAHLEAVELEGMVDEDRHLHLDERLPIKGPRRVRVIVLFATEEIDDEHTWLGFAASNSAFSDLHDPAEDIYTPQDGKPIS